MSLGRQHEKARIDVSGRMTRMRDTSTLCLPESGSPGPGEPLRPRRRKLTVPLSHKFAKASGYAKVP